MGGGLDALDGPREKIDMDSFIRKPAGEKAQVFKEAEERLSFAFCLIGDYVGTPLKVKQSVHKLIDFAGKGLAVLYAPNFCMAECSRAFAKIAYRGTKDHDRATGVYQSYVRALLNVVSKTNKGIIQSYELQRSHLVNVEDVFDMEYRKFGQEKRGFLSGLDALVVAIGRQLAREHGREQTFIVTAEDRMTRICNYSDGDFPRAVNLTKQPVPV